MTPFLHEMWKNMEKGDSGRQQITLMNHLSFDLGVNASRTLSRGFTVKKRTL